MTSASTRDLIESNAREATDLTGELMLLLERAAQEPACLAQARLVTRRLSDRLGQARALQRLTGAGAVRLDAWSPTEMMEELEHEARALARAEVQIVVQAPNPVPPYWFFDRELVAMTLRNALHSALGYARHALTLEFDLVEEYLGFSISDDAGAFPDEVLRTAPLPAVLSECNGNALGIHFARLVAEGHRSHGRRGWLELENLANGAGTRLSLWLP